MFQVFRNNRALKGINLGQGEFIPEGNGYGFTSYERARQALRKYIRVAVKRGKLSDGRFGWMSASRWDNISRNPVGYTNAGFAIKKVA